MDIRALIAGLVVGAVVALVVDNAWVRLHLSRLALGKEKLDALRHAQEGQLRAVERAEAAEMEIERLREGSFAAPEKAALLSRIEELESVDPLLQARILELEAALDARDDDPAVLGILRDENVDLRAKLEAAQESLSQAADKQLAEKNSVITELERELVSLREAQVSVTTERDDLRAKLQAAQRSMSSAAGEQLAEKNNVISELENELVSLRDAQISAAKELDNLRARSTAEAAAHEAKLTEMRNAIYALETASPAISDADLARLKERADLSMNLAGKAEGLLAERDALVAELASLKNQRPAETGDGAGLRDRLMALSQEGATLKRSLASAYAQIETMKSKIAGTHRQDLTRVPGVSAEHAAKLADSGVRTFEDLARVRTESLLDILELSDSEHVLARSWQDEARKLAAEGDA